MRTPPTPAPKSIEQLIATKALALSDPELQTQASYAEVLVHLSEFARSCIVLAAQFDDWEEALRDLDDVEYRRRQARKRRRKK